MNADAESSTNADRVGQFTTPSPDRPATPEEAAAAEQATKDLRVEEVSHRPAPHHHDAHRYEEMIEHGANVSGEGQIEALLDADSDPE